MNPANWLIVHLLLGFWLFISPYTLGFAEVTEAYLNAMLAGSVIMISSMIGLYSSHDEGNASETFRQARRA